MKVIKACDIVRFPQVVEKSDADGLYLAYMKRFRLAPHKVPVIEDRALAEFRAFQSIGIACAQRIKDPAVITILRAFLIEIDEQLEQQAKISVEVRVL